MLGKGPKSVTKQKIFQTAEAAERDHLKPSHGYGMMPFMLLVIN